MNTTLQETAAANGLAAFFRPRVVAVIGASRERNKIGTEILHNLLRTNFTGTIVPVHPSASHILGLPAYPRVTAIPLAVDLAIVAVPAAGVEGVVDDCIAKGVRAICIITAGFGECSAEGRERERTMVSKARAAGCRVVGPNCMGLLNTDPEVMLNATFSPFYPPPGNVAMSTQSGALGLAILDHAKKLKIGISSFVSVGNKADVSGNDLLEYWETDPSTSVILLYLESFGNPAKFSRLARRISRTKPIVALKSGRSAVGAKAAASHTGALASSDKFVDALFHQSGVIRTDTVTELFDVASILSRQPIPAGRRVAIVTNAGGPGILAADACQSHGLEVAELTATTRDALRRLLPPAAAVNNPVDMLAAASPAHYEAALDLVLADPNVDSALVIFIPPLVTDADEVAAAIARAAGRVPGKPLAGIFMRTEDAPAALESIPCFAFPEPAAIAMSRVASYGEWRRKEAGVVPFMTGVQPALARLVVERALERGGGWLTAIEANALLAAAGISTPRSNVATSVDDAVEMAERLGYPVALKAVGRSILHKTEYKALHLNLANRMAVRMAATALTKALGDKVEGLLVQRMVSGGVEMMLGAINDPTFGHVIVCGSGGVMIELLDDSACRLHPVTDQDAAEMVHGLKGARLLRGYRGSAPADEAAFQESILRISALVGICPEIQELDVNPLAILEEGVSALDVRVRVSANAHPTTLTTPTRQG
ncbi:MAG TPA: acetate--CoA ligase family protein [Vicinamibacterales bacterium]|nr:acetate--CoA ligase family protein [Vicinamibacterales bacterium]